MARMTDRLTPRTPGTLSLQVLVVGFAFLSFACDTAQFEVDRGGLASGQTEDLDRTIAEEDIEECAVQTDCGSCGQSVCTEALPNGVCLPSDAACGNTQYCTCLDDTCTNNECRDSPLSLMQATGDELNAACSHCGATSEEPLAEKVHAYCTSSGAFGGGYGCLETTGGSCEEDCDACTMLCAQPEAVMESYLPAETPCLQDSNDTCHNAIVERCGEVGAVTGYGPLGDVRSFGPDAVPVRAIACIVAPPRATNYFLSWNALKAEVDTVEARRGCEPDASDRASALAGCKSLTQTLCLARTSGSVASLLGEVDFGIQLPGESNGIDFHCLPAAGR